MARQPGLAVRLLHPVNRLLVGELLAVRRLQLLNQTAPGETAALELGLCRFDRLGLPVGVDVVHRELGVGLGEPFAVL